MLDNYLQNRLVLWSHWRMRRGDGGLGFPKHVAFAQKTQGSGFWTPELDSDCIDVDKAVCALELKYRNAIIAHYCEAGTKEGKAKQLGYCVRTYDDRLSTAKRYILGYLNDLAAGIPLPVQTSGQMEVA